MRTLVALAVLAVLAFWQWLDRNSDPHPKTLDPRAYHCEHGGRLPCDDLRATP